MNFAPGLRDPQAEGWVLAEMARARPASHAQAAPAAVLTSAMGLAWLPPELGEPQQAVLMLVLKGVAVGAVALTLFNLAAALKFAVACLLPLVLRLAPIRQPPCFALRCFALRSGRAGSCPSLSR